MKFRALAGAAVMGLLLATTACGTGNLANNAYGVNRAYDGNVRHGVIRDGGRVNRVSTYGRGVNTATGRTMGRRLGNAVHNTGNPINNTTGFDIGLNNGNRINRRATNNASGVNQNTRAGTRTNATRRSNAARAQINNGSNMNHAVNNGRVDGTQGTSGLNVANTRNRIDGQQQRNTGAYNNPGNFSNALYTHQGNQMLNGQQNFDGLMGGQNYDFTTPTPNVQNRMSNNQVSNGYLTGDTNANTRHNTAQPGQQNNTNRVNANATANQSTQRNSSTIGGNNNNATASNPNTNNRNTNRAGNANANINNTTAQVNARR